MSKGPKLPQLEVFVKDSNARVQCPLAAADVYRCAALPIFKSIKSRRDRSRGQATIEYALLLGLAALISVAFMGMFTNVIKTSLTSFGAVLEQELTNGDWQGQFQEAGTAWEN